MAELLIADARRLHDAGLAGEALHDLLHERQATGLVAFLGQRSGIGAPRVAARTGGAAEALRVWVDGFAGYLDAQRELREPLGSGTVVLIGVEVDGTARCVTWSQRKTDCARMKGWADRVVFPVLSVWPWRTHCGWGTGGVPTPLTTEERGRLTTRQGELYGNCL